MTVVPSNHLASSYAMPVSANSGYNAENMHSDPKPQESPLINMCFLDVNDPEYVAYNNTLNQRVNPISSERMNRHFSSIATLLPLIIPGKPSRQAGKILNDKTVSLLKPPQVKEHSNAIPIPTAPHNAPAQLYRARSALTRSDRLRLCRIDSRRRPSQFGNGAPSANQFCFVSLGHNMSIPPARSIERGSREKYNADLARDQALDEEIRKTLFGPEASSLPTPTPTIKQEKLMVFSLLAACSTILTILLMNDVWQGPFWPTLVS